MDIIKMEICINFSRTYSPVETNKGHVAMYMYIQTSSTRGTKHPHKS